MPRSSDRRTTAATSASSAVAGSTSTPSAAATSSGATAATASEPAWASEPTTPAGSTGRRPSPTPIAWSVPSSWRSRARPDANSARRAGTARATAAASSGNRPDSSPASISRHPVRTPAGARPASAARRRLDAGRGRQEMPSDWSNVTSPHFLAAVSRPSIVQRPSVETVSMIVHGWNRRTSLAHTKNTLPAIGQSAVDR